MKKSLILFIALFMSLNLFADGDVKLEKGKENSPQTEVPIVNIEGNQLTISADKPIANVVVIIKNEVGEVVVMRWITIEPAAKTFTIPSPDVSEMQKFCIELYTADNMFYGYFLV